MTTSAIRPIARGTFTFPQGQAGFEIHAGISQSHDVYNGKLNSIAKEIGRHSGIGEGGRHWHSLATQVLPDNRVRITMEMPSPRLYVARSEPYRISDLERG